MTGGTFTHVPPLATPLLWTLTQTRYSAREGNQGVSSPDTPLDADALSAYYAAVHRPIQTKFMRAYGQIT